MEKLKSYDLISFDMFDTLILRPMDAPTDLFYFLQNELKISDFKSIRMNAEEKARENSKKNRGHNEISLHEIWENMINEVGPGCMDGEAAEIRLEREFCYANPLMIKVWKQLIQMDKHIIVTTDMYLPQDVLETILQDNGFCGYEKIYLSNVFGENKAEGTLYDRIRKNYPGFKKIHIGDNIYSDVRMAGAHGFDSIWYPNINATGNVYRAHDMSCMIGSAYRGIVNSHLYNGYKQYTTNYEYGYIYGGLFVVGYCNFIHDYCMKNGIDRLLFLSRDGDILKTCYDCIFPGENTEYVYWSRKAAVKLMYNEDRHDYYRRLIWHKVNQSYTVQDILHSMELDILQGLLKDKEAEYQLKLTDQLTVNKAEQLKDFLESCSEQIINLYSDQNKATASYYRTILKNCHKAAAIDIGWAGSGALALSHLASDIWKIPCEITGIVAGTNSMHTYEVDAAEPFLQNGLLVAYMFSQRHNRDLWKKHDPGKDYNIFWELLLSSQKPQFKGFYSGNQTERLSDGKKKNEGQPEYLENMDITMDFGEYDANIEGIQEIQSGIIDFVNSYRKHFAKYPYMLNVSGRDAYAPMMVAASSDEKYLKSIEKNFKLTANVE